VLSALGALLLIASPASAATVQATCPTFGATLAAVHDGDTIVLTGMCTNANTDIYNGIFTLPPGVKGLTIEGAATGTNGFTGTAIVTGAALSSPVGGTDGLTLSNLTFHNYAGTLGAVRLVSTNNAVHPFVFVDDTFTGNGPTNAVDGGGLAVSVHETGACAFIGGQAVTLSQSTFSGNSAHGGPGTGGAEGGGGGALIDIECASGVAAATVSGNRFTSNTVSAQGTAHRQGGGLYIGAGGRFVVAVPVTLTQSGNVFDGNSVTGSGGSYSGGGEFTVGANVTSTNDSFTNNTIPGPTTNLVASEGGGFATVGGGGCTTPPGATSAATNLIAAGNSIGPPSGSGTGAQVEGAGVYIGCGPIGTGGYTMTLNNSTIAGNTASGTAPAAGIDGETTDTLVAHNSIIAGNSGGKDVGGFGASDGANVTATFSDLCAIGSTTTPFTGAGNICALPSLVDAGHGDVHQTNASPTIDAGSNSLIPAGVTTDAFGNPRVASGRPGAAATVDIGAAENVLNPTVSDCSKLQTALSSAVSGDVITLAALCTVANSGSAQDSFLLPLGLSSLTLQGAAPTDGFDGTGATSSALEGSAVGLAMRNLTVEHYSLTGTASVQLSPGPGAMPSLDGLTFSQNSNSVVNSLGAGLLIESFTSNCPYTGTLSISHSTFSGNQLNASATSGSGPAGAGLLVILGCTGASTAGITLTDNTFKTNSIVTHGAGALGAGVYIANGDNSQLSATQSGNAFDGNSITVLGTPASSYNGAGEWLASVNLVSNGDKFTDNSLPGPSGATATSEGAGLGVVRGTCGSPASSTPATAIATNVTVAGNLIGAPSLGGKVEGAGIYAGCEPQQGNGGFHLTVRNSTVSENDGPGGVSGIDGEAGDTLTLQNSIVTGNIGAGSADLGGFGIGGGTGSVTAASSDVCATGGTVAAFAGSGNICADPLLVSAGSGDVHETTSSPTIDRGSNALVPAGLTTDFFGQKRTVGTNQAAGIVDIGAAEWQTAFSTIGTVKISGEKATGSGVVLTLSCAGTTGQSCSGTGTLTTTETLLGSKVVAVAAAHKPTKHHKRRHKHKARVGRASYKLAAGRKLTLHIKLNHLGIVLLKKFGRLPVRVTVTAKGANGKTITVSSRKLQIKRHKHRR
jgi:hypothetical protein